MKAFFLLLACMPFPLLAQQNITVDIETGLATQSARLNVNGAFDLNFINSAKLGSNKTLTVDFESPVIGAVLTKLAITDPASKTTIDKYTNTAVHAKDLTITISKKVGQSKKLISRFLLTPNGDLSNIDASLKNETVYSISPLTAGLLVPDMYKHHTVILYDPCNNTYSIQRNSTNHRAIWKPYALKKESKQSGVIFLIRNINTLKYDISLSNSFVSQHTEIPALFNSISTMISGGASLAATTDISFSEEISKVVQLNSDLKNLLNHNCIDFEQSKRNMRNNVSLNFAEANGIVSIDENYKKAKDAVAVARRNVGTPIDNDGINKEFQNNLHLPISPDSLLTETIQFYNLFMATDFFFQSNVIQLENADELQYTLNIAGKKDTKNTTLNVPNQLIRIPILGGIKIDFSTGFYYSDIKNEKYSLRTVMIDTIVKKEIVNDGNTKTGAVGIAALMHIYARLNPYISPAVTLGLGKSLENNYSLLLGGSIILGRDNRVALSGGLNFSNIKSLSNSNKDKLGNWLTLPGSTTEISYRNKFKRGAFLSFTYSFGGGRKAQAAASADAAEKKDED